MVSLDKCWFLWYVSEPVYFHESLLRSTDMCGIWYQFGSSFFLVFLFFGVVLLSFKFFFFFVVKEDSSLVTSFMFLTFSVTKHYRFPNVIEGLLARIGPTLQTLISIFKSWTCRFFELLYVLLRLEVRFLQSFR